MWQVGASDVLRILLSEFDEGQEEPSSGIILGPSGGPHAHYHSVCRAQLLNRFRRMMDFHDFSWSEPGFEQDLDVSGPRGPRWRAMLQEHDSQSSIASV